MVSPPGKQFSTGTLILEFGKFGKNCAHRKQAATAH